MKWACVGNTGLGKTLAIVLKIKELMEKDPNKHTWSNFHVNLPNCHFTPIMFLPFDKLKNCIIAYDDVSTQEVLKRYVKTSANRSRKTDMELMFTCQDYTMIPKPIRKMIDFRIFPKLDKEKDILTLHIIQKGKGLLPVETYHDVIKYIKKTKLYDTNEVVDDPTESEILSEIARISETPRDIEKNLMLYTGNKAERKILYKEIYEMKGFDKEEKERLRKKKEKEEKIRKQKYLRQKKEIVNYIANNINLKESQTYIKGKIYEKLDTIKSKIYIEYSDFSEIVMRATAIFRDREIHQEQTLKEKNITQNKIENNNIKDLEITLLAKHFNAKQYDIKEKFGYSQSQISKICNQKIKEIKSRYFDIIPAN